MKNNIKYRVFKDKNVEKFLDKNSEDVALIERVERKILELSDNPYLCAEKSFRSRKCPKCKKKLELVIIDLFTILSQITISLLN